MIGPHSTSSHRLFDILNYIVDPRVGIIQELCEARRDAGAPNLFSFFAKACDTRAFCSQKNFEEAGGSSRDRKTAMGKAIGEAIERYCAAFYDPSQLPLYSYNSAPFLCTSPEKFALFSQEQFVNGNFPFHPFTRDTEVRWSPAKDASTGETQFVPAAMVYLPYFYGEGELPFVPTISTGLACHCSETEAAISAICEVVERDAFTITWQARISPPHIVLPSLPESLQDLIARYEQTGARIDLFNITLDHGIPTILSVMRYGTQDAPALLLSGACHPNPEVAITKTLEELELCRRLGQLLKRQIPPVTPNPTFSNIDTQFSHIRLFCEHDNLHLTNFLFRGNKRVIFSDLPNISQENRSEVALEALMESIKHIDHQVLLTDITTPEIKELGLFVLRAIIPGFHPLFFGHSTRALGGTRLWSIPQKLGYEGISRETGDNSVPHPFP